MRAVGAYLRGLCSTTETIAAATVTPLSPNPVEEIKALNAYYYEVAAKRLAAQLANGRQLDTKSTSFFSIGSTILPIVVGFAASERSLVSGSGTAASMFIVGFGCYGLLALFYVLSLRGGRWIEIPDMEQFREISSLFSVQDLQRALGDSCTEAYRANEPAIDRKAKWSAFAMWCLFGEVISLSVAVVIPLWPFHWLW